MNAQIEQLRNEIADKQKELETLEQFPYERGQLVYVSRDFDWIVEFDKIINGDFYCNSCSILDGNEILGYTRLCSLDHIITHRLATESDLNRLPDGHKWKPKKLPTTIEEVCEVLKSNFYIDAYNTVKYRDTVRTSYSSTQQNAERVRAYNNLLNVIEWGNREWSDYKGIYISIDGLPSISKHTFNHIKTYFSNDLKTFQS